MVALSINLLGSSAALLDGRPVVPMRTNKVQALLSYLVTERVFAPGVFPRRETVMALLWPGMPDTSARQNLRQAVYLLRQTIPEVAGPEGNVPFLLSDYHTIQVNPQARYMLDVSAFVELVAIAEPQALAEATALYRGDFLNDFYLDDSNEYEEWAAGRRGILRFQALDALEALAGHHLAQGNYQPAEEVARRQVAMDPFREEGHRQLIEALARSGRRSAALAAYDGLADLFARELRVAPSVQTQQLVDLVRAGTVQATPHGSGHARGYDLQEQIGQGSFGTVYRAIQPTVGREVAVKAIRRRYANDPDFIRRFEAEAQMVARLEHPHIVPLYDYWREPGGAYLIMRWMRGGSLKEALSGDAWSPEKVVPLLEEVASALDAAHQRGIVHLDIKPANILLDEAGRAYLTDFGIAKEWRPGRESGDRVTAGSPHYMAPEQVAGRELTPQSDIYSLGLVLYEMLAGRRPYAETPTGLVLVKRLSEPLPLLRDLQPELFPAIEAVLQKATDPDPAERYATAAALATAFRQAVEGEKTILPAVIPPRREVPNPYLGLRAFSEAEADRFYGREALTRQLVEALRESPFLVLVGPSGSGKSSVVRAGLLPALRRGALPGSEQWFITDMIPGERPYEELEASLLRVAVNPPATLLEQLQADERGLVRAVKRLLPEREGTLLLVVDQFEELYTLVEDEAVRNGFRNMMQAAVEDPAGLVRVVLTLRADFFDRPLGTQAFGELVRNHTVVVVPPTEEELARAIRLPAEQAGAGVEEALMSTLVNDVYDRPGALPLLQYALTELFGSREQQYMTLHDYERIGGVQGALANRAEALYQELDEAQKPLTRQLFLRLVAVGEGAEDTRRRVLRSELETLVAKESVQSGEGTGGRALLAAIIDRFGRRRLLTFDHDTATRTPTVEVAHEALLVAWPRFQAWIETGRDDLRQQRRLNQWAQEWEEAGRNPGLLLRSARLDQTAGWAAQTDMALSGSEADLLAASIAAREERAAAEEARRLRELETAQRLAGEEKARAAEQAEAARRLRRRAAYLAAALSVAVLLALAAVFFGRQSNLNAQTALTNEQVALNNQATAEAEAVQRATAQAEAEIQGGLAAAEANQRATAQAVAEQQQMLAADEANQRATAQAVAESERAIAEEQRNITFSRELAGAALLNLDIDPELSMMLALQALEAAHTVEAENVLHQALAESRVERTLAGHPVGIGVLTFSPDGALLASGGGDNSTRIWEVASGRLLHVLSGYDNEVTGLAFDPTGERLAAGSYDGTTRIWNVQTGEEEMTLSLVETEEGFYNPWVEEVAFSPDGRFLAAGAYNQVIVWDLATGQPALSFLEGRENVAFSPDGRFLVFNNAVNIGDTLETWPLVTVYDLGTGEVAATLSGHSISPTGMSFSPHGKLLASQGGDAVRIWGMDPDSPETFGRQVAELDPGHIFPASAIDFLSDNRRILFKDDTATLLKVWDVQQQAELFSFRCGRSPNAVVVNPAGTLVAASNLDGTIRLCRLDPTFEWQTFTYTVRDPSSPPRFRDVAFNAEGTVLYTATSDGRLAAWDATKPGSFYTGQEMVLVENPGARYYELALDPGGEWLAAGALDGFVYLWDAETLQEVRAFGGHSDWVLGMDISADGERLATASGDTTARVWDLSTGDELYTLSEFMNEVWDIDFSPDGKLLAIMSNSAAAGWDATAGAELFDIPVEARRAAEFSPDGRYLATSGFDTIVRLWDISDYEGNGLLTEIRRMTGHQGLVQDLAFSPDGTKLASTGYDNTARIWKVATGEELLSFQSHTDLPWRLTFSPDGRRLATASYDGTVRVFLLDLDEVVALAQERLTRWFTEDECRRLLHMNVCPPAPWEE